MADTVLEVENLTKKFGPPAGGFTAVDNISFELKEGEILGFLGVNGAGKTTTIQMLLGVLTPTNGEIKYFGKDLKEHRSEIMEYVNFSSTYTNLPWVLTVRENLDFISFLYDIKNRKQRIDKIVQVFNLQELLDKQIHQLSAGQQTKVNLAKAFINFPKILLLDEPTASLDVEIADSVRKLLLEQKKNFNVSVILTSHNMAEVEEVSDRVIFIDSGKIIADDTPENLAKSIQVSHVELYLKEGLEKVVEFCQKAKLANRVKGKRIVIDVNEKEIASLLQGLTKNGIAYEEISIEKPTLEDYFLQTIAKD